MQTALDTPSDTKLRALEQELSEFTYIVSHDLAAPLRHIRGFTDLLKLDAPGFTPDQQSCCSQIQIAAEKAAAMLEQLLLYSRLMRRPLEPAECDLGTVLDGVRLQLGEDIRASGATIIANDLGRAVVDRELFTQALRHLVSNAVKFRRDGVAPRVTIARGDGPCLRVTDNGIGLPPDVDPERLFWMFYRGQPETYPGFGVGLAMARRIARMHGGDIRFEPRSGGACAEISLPSLPE